MQFCNIEILPKPWNSKTSKSNSSKMKLNVSAAPCMALSKKYRKTIFKENIQKSKKEGKN